MGTAVTVYRPATVASEYLVNANLGLWADGVTKTYTNENWLSDRTSQMNSAVRAGLYKGWDKDMLTWDFLVGNLMYPSPWGYPAPDHSTLTLEQYVQKINESSGTVSG